MFGNMKNTYMLRKFKPYILEIILVQSDSHSVQQAHMPKSGLVADSANLMCIMMAELAELIFADSILIKAHLYPWE